MSEVFEALLGPSPRYKFHEMDAAVAARESVVPELVAYLEALAADPSPLHDEDEMGPLYVLTLATHFAEPRAHAPLLALARLAPALLELIGDWVTDELPRALLATCDGRTEGLRALVEDRAAWDYARCAGIVALTATTIGGHADREETLAWLAALLERDDFARPDEYVWTEAFGAMLDLCPIGYEDLLRRLVDGDLLEPMVFSPSAIEDALAYSPDYLLQRTTTDLHPHDEIHEYIAWWACFEENQRPTRIRSGRPLPARRPRKKTKTERNRAKAARKKQRKRK